MRTKAPFFMVSPRDFVIASKLYKNENGTVDFVSKSTLHASMPPQNGCERADLIIQAWHLEPVSEKVEKMGEEAIFMISKLK